MPSDSASAIPTVVTLIRFVRGQRVIMDVDPARIYGVPTKRLNEAITRNAKRFPADFMFQLTPQELTILRSQTATSSAEGMRSQIATASKRNVRFRPYAFTEHGALMAANVLRSDRAVQMSVFVVRAFVKMRETLAAHRDLADKLADLERNLTTRLSDHDKVLRYVLTELRKLMNSPEPPRKEIGFRVRERKNLYRVATRA